MDTMGTTTSREAAAREAASRMAAAAAAWLDALEPAQRAVATGGAPSADAGFGLELLARRDQAGEHRVVEGVALLRPVKADVRDAVRGRHRDPLLGHHRSLVRP